MEVSPNNDMVRFTTRSSTKAEFVALKPRGPLKRRRSVGGKIVPHTAVNGSKENKDASEDEESPSKKTKSDTEGEGDDMHDGDKMDFTNTEFTNTELDKDEEMTAEDDQDAESNNNQQREALLSMQQCPKRLNQKVAPSLENKDPALHLRSRRAIHRSDSDKGSPKLIPKPNGPEVRTFKMSSIKEYQEKMKEGAKSTAITSVYQQGMAGYCPTDRTSITSRGARNVNKLAGSKMRLEPLSRAPNLHGHNQAASVKKQGTKKPVFPKRSSRSSSRGYMCVWRLCQVLLVLLVSAGLGLLAWQYFLVPSGESWMERHPVRSVEPREFTDQLSALRSQFPSQSPELWRRSRIHLERHLQTAHPTEPVSLILTAGTKAEKTLHCLAQRLACAFSSALNASVLNIDGASKASQDSDQVKLEIDGQLQRAFEGDQPVAVIHRFEELPPGSTLIFYRYCDHENAAYKNVFLAFTVLLPQGEVEKEQTLKAVEETVQDYLTERFLSGDSGRGQTAFNSMDTDKLSGLWSRISHLVLPVVSEEEVERSGCVSD